jgi:thiol-disulfide isomerase/thioredoxin
MKLLLTLLFTILHSNLSAQLFIKGIINNDNHEEVYLFEPINCFYNGSFLKPNSLIHLSNDNYFEEQIELKHPSMISLSVGIRRIYFYGEPGDTIEMAIDVNKFSSTSPNGGIKFYGKNHKGNEYFNLLNWQSGRKFGEYENIADDSLHFRKTNDFKATDFALNKVTSYFDTLLNKKQITSEFYNTIVPGIKAILITREIRYLLVEQNKMTFKEALAKANRIYQHYPVTSDMIKCSAFGNSIAYYYFKTLAAIAMHATSEHLKDSSLIVNGKKVLINNNLVYWLYAPKNMQEILWASSLIDLKKSYADRFGQNDVDAFLALHPESPYRHYVVSAFNHYDLPSNHSDSALIKILNDTDSKKFDEFISSNFKGKRIYVDIWASWCVPCKQEFAFMESVDSFCEKNNIEILYVSIDRPNMKNAMIRNIYAYNLAGYHIRANKSMYTDIENIFSDENKFFTIPRYLLINEKGVVVNANAPRPSSGNELFKEMQTDFKID